MLHSYSQVLFSDSTLLGALLLALTFLYPLQGLAGLACCLISIVAVLAMGIPSEKVESGYHGLNGMLVGLALGLFFSFNLAFLVILVLAGALVAVVAVVIKNFLGSLTGLPAMSLPFVTVTILIFLAVRGFANLEISIAPISLARWLDVFALPPFLDTFFRSLGATLFQVSSLAGMIIFVILVCFSRISALLSLVGFASGAAVYLSLGGSLAEVSSDFIGFNFILVAVAIGGVFLVPAWPAYLLAAVAAAVSALVAAGSHQILSSFGVPVLALPYNLTVILFVYALKFNSRHPSLQLVSLLVWRPEDNLRHHRGIAMRAPHPLHVRLEPPFLGERLVSQSTDGEETHKERWSHAWDFVIDQGGRQTDSDLAGAADDFYVFDTPVTAPADGTVVRTVEHLEDNLPGTIDREHNWGNCVVLWHLGALYSGVYHLKKDSLEVATGDHVRRGQILGRCGNSGRSSVPHLHLQAQIGPEPGSPTLPAVLAGYVRLVGKHKSYHPVGNPGKGETIALPEPWDEVREAFGMAIGRRYLFAIEGEPDPALKWEVDVDFLGYLFLKDASSGQKLYFENSGREIVFGKLEGSAAGKLQALLLAVPRVPLCRLAGLAWEDRLPPELFTGTAGRLALDLLRPFGEPYRAISRTTYRGREIVGLGKAETNAHLIETRVLKKRFADNGAGGQEKTLATGRMWFDRILGPVRIEVDYANGQSIHLSQIVATD